MCNVIIIVLVKIPQFLVKLYTLIAIERLSLSIKDYYALSHTIYIPIVMVIPLYDMNEFVVWYH